MSDVVCVLPSGALLGEGALWDGADQRLYWVDIKGRAVHRFDPATGGDERWPVAEPVGSLAVRQRGGLVLALRTGFHFFDPATGHRAEPRRLTARARSRVSPGPRRARRSRARGPPRSSGR